MGGGKQVQKTAIIRHILENTEMFRGHTDISAYIDRSVNDIFTDD